jgi:hypothetical protein
MRWRHIERKAGKEFYFAFFLFKIREIKRQISYFSQISDFNFCELSKNLNHFKEINLGAAFIPRWDKEKASWVYKKDKDL